MIVRLLFALLALRLDSCSGVGGAGGSPGEHPTPRMTMQLQRHNRREGSGRPRRKNRMMSAAYPPDLAPVFPGYGTHYVFVYVGTPPQRQSVILDTGSHYTAFPCAGCNNCGKHTDDYYDPDHSNTETVPQCGSSTCKFSQSYAEGSSWHAYKVNDILWVGGEVEEDGSSVYQVPYSFGCQSSLTGLFRTQLENGIMGMSMGDDSLPSQLHKAGITQSTVFGLCFSIDGGVLTLGGVDPSVHADPRAAVPYAKLYRRSNWYGVKVLDMRLLKRGGDEVRFEQKASIAASFTGSSMSTIVDSGTTDTYLPSSLLQPFSVMFKSITGVAFKTNIQITLTDEQMAEFPDLLFELEAAGGGGSLVVRMPWEHCLERVDGTNKYEFVIFFEERNGAILGANFMDGHNVIFDQANNRVGFAESDCDYATVAPPAPTALPSEAPTPFPTPRPLMPPEWTPAGPCDARCDLADPKAVYTKVGSQRWLDLDDGVTTVDRTCTVHCATDNSIAFSSFGQPLQNRSCPLQPWGPCSDSCEQSRPVLGWLGECQAGPEDHRECYGGGCQMNPGDYVVNIRLSITYPMARWSVPMQDEMSTALATAFQVTEGSIQMVLNESATHGNVFVLDVEIRERQAAAAPSAAERLVASIRADLLTAFVDGLLDELNAISIRSREVDYSVYGWMTADDIQVISLAANRLPGAPTSSNEEELGNKGPNILLSATLALGFIVSVAAFLCYRVRTTPEAAGLTEYSKVVMNEEEVELTGLQAGRPVDLSDARLDESDLDSSRV